MGATAVRYSGTLRTRLEGVPMTSAVATAVGGGCSPARHFCKHCMWSSVPFTLLPRASRSPIFVPYLYAGFCFSPSRTALTAREPCCSRS